MNNRNIIKLNDYVSNNEAELEFHKHRRRSAACSWIVTIADTVMTLSISVCTLFCMYLAFTML